MVAVLVVRGDIEQFRYYSRRVFSILSVGHGTAVPMRDNRTDAEILRLCLYRGWFCHHRRYCRFLVRGVVGSGFNMTAPLRS